MHRAVVCTLALSACLVQASSTLAQCSYPDDYPYPTQSYLQADPWLFYYRECTSYVAWAMNRDHGTPTSPYWFTNHMMGGTWGNAEHWSTNATSLGFPVSNMPGVGAIAHYSVTESPSFGHVAYVKKVNTDGSVDLQEYNWGCSHCYGVRCSVRPPRFIFLHGQPPPLKFGLGDTVQVTGVSPDTLTVRGPNACDAAIAQKVEGSVGQIVSGSMVRCGSGSSYFNRWQIQWTNGVTGWSAEDWLTKIVPPNCTYNVAPASTPMAWSGGSGSFTVTTLNGCPWTATPSAGWITITTGTSGSASGPVEFTIDANLSRIPRTGTITVQGQSHTINQSGSIPGDFDFNSHVDSDDYAHFQPCMTGADVTSLPVGCSDADLDGDNDIDQSDFSIFQRCMTGSGVIGNPTCAE